MKSGKMDHDKGRSLVWCLSQIRPMLEAEALARIERRLDELGRHADGRHNGELGTPEPLRLTSEDRRARSIA